MQKKHTFFIVVGLGIATFVALQLVRGTGRFFKTSVVNMPLDSGKMGMMLEEPEFFVDQQKALPSAGGAESSFMAVDRVAPSIGIIPPFYDDYAYDVEERSYEKSSHHSVVVSDVTKYLRTMKEYLLSVDGIIVNSSMNSSSKYDSGSLFVKVPVDKFDEATSRVTEDVKKVIDENIIAYDITGQVVSRQENVTYLKEQKELKEAQLKDAKTEVEKKRIEIEIERLERQITAAEKSQENVENRTRYSSVSITAASSERYFNPDASGDVRYEFERAWESLKSLLKVGLLFGVWIAVYSIVWLPIVWIFGKILKRFKS